MVIRLSFKVGFEKIKKKARFWDLGSKNGGGLERERTRVLVREKTENDEPNVLIFSNFDIL